MSRYQDPLGIGRPCSGLIYYNALTVNNGRDPIKADYTSVESSAIIDRPKDYHLSVIRFYLSARNLLPIFWWQQTQDLLLPQQFGTYQVSMSYGGTVISENLVFRPPGQGVATTPPPNQNRSLDAVNALYWGVYSHSYFLSLINATLKSVYSRISALVPAAPPVVEGCRAPFLRFEPGSGLISLIVGRPFNPLYSEQFFANPDTIKIWFNAELYTFFSESLEYSDFFRSGTNPLGSPLDVAIRISDRGSQGNQSSIQQCYQNTLNPLWLPSASYTINRLVEYGGLNYRALAPSIGLPPPLNPLSWQQVDEIIPDFDPSVAYALGQQVQYSGSGSGQYWICRVGGTSDIPGSSGDWQLDPSLFCYIISQDYPSTYRWIAVQRYLLLGSGLGAVAEFTPAANGGYNQTSQPFLIDFTPDYSSSADAAGTGSGNVLYTPSAEFKRIELQGDTPIKAITLTVAIMTNTGVIVPVYLGPQGSFSCKLLFERIGHVAGSK